MENIENIDDEFYECDEDCEPEPKKGKKAETVESQLSKIYKLFDEVLFDSSNEKYHLLTCQNRVKNKGVIEKEVWLQIKIGKDDDCSNLPYDHYSLKSLVEYVKSIVKDILDYKESLFSINEKQKPTQANLFGEEVEDVFSETEPEKHSEKWFRWSDKKNLSEINKLNFLDIFDFKPRGNHLENDWSKFLPTNEELIEIIKKNILKYENNPGRYEGFWWNNERDYINNKDALSDYDLQSRIVSVLRIFLVPYTRFKHYGIDLSYSCNCYDDSVSYHFYFDYRKVNTWSSMQLYKNLPEYDIFNSDLTQFVRELYDVPFKETINDEEALDLAAVEIFRRFTKGVDISDAKKMANNHKDWKSFRAALTKDIKNESLGGGSSYGELDGYSYHCEAHTTKLVLKLNQNTKHRKSLGLPTDGLQDSFYTDESQVCEYNGNEAFEKMFDCFTREKRASEPKQLDLFDLFAA